MWQNRIDASKEIRRNIIKNILRLCKQRGWTLGRLASEARVATGTVSTIINKEHHNPTIGTLVLLSNALGVTVFNLMGGGSK